MNGQDKAVNVLNELIRTSQDGVAGFNAAAAQVKDPTLRELFREQARGCSNATAQLQSMVLALGGIPDTAGTVGGILRRGWARAHAAVSRNGDVAVLEDVERSEDRARTVYAEALLPDLPAEVTQAIGDQYQGVVRNHDYVRDLCNQFRLGAR
jgi:uncharacterized protein (TIGR02284 family)